MARKSITSVCMARIGSPLLSIETAGVICESYLFIPLRPASKQCPEQCVYIFLKKHSRKNVFYSKLSRRTNLTLFWQNYSFLKNCLYNNVALITLFMQHLCVKVQDHISSYGLNIMQKQPQTNHARSIKACTFGCILARTTRPAHLPSAFQSILCSPARYFFLLPFYIYLAAITLCAPKQRVERKEYSALE